MPNPCCGVKLKSGVVLIACADTIYGLVLLALGLGIYIHRSESKNLQFYTSGSEFVNLVVHPIFKVLTGLVLWFSASFSFLVSKGYPSVMGCTLWIVTQSIFLALTLFRIVDYLREDSHLGANLFISGASTWESYAILVSILPMVSLGAMAFEILCVACFIPKVMDDSKKGPVHQVLAENVIRTGAIRTGKPRTSADSADVKVLKLTSSPQAHSLKA